VVTLEARSRSGRLANAVLDGKPTGEAARRWSGRFRDGDDLTWWVEAAKAQREKKKPPYEATVSASSLRTQGFPACAQLRSSRRRGLSFRFHGGRPFGNN